MGGWNISPLSHERARFVFVRRISAFHLSPSLSVSSLSPPPPPSPLPPPLPPLLLHCLRQVRHLHHPFRPPLRLHQQLHRASKLPRLHRHDLGHLLVLPLPTCRQLPSPFRTSRYSSSSSSRRRRRRRRRRCSRGWRSCCDSLFNPPPDCNRVVAAGTSVVYLRT